MRKKIFMCLIITAVALLFTAGAVAAEEYEN